MPTYTFRNKVTGESWDAIMSYNDSLKYLEENPDIEKDITTKFPGMVSGVDSQRKCDEGFNDLIREMNKKNAHRGVKSNVWD